jgi:hypothetical protein
MSPSSDPPLQVSIDLDTHVQHTCERHIVILFKECLAMFEQLAEEHDEALGKLYDNLPPEYRAYVELADHFTEDKAARIRRAVLARGNDCKRAIAEELVKYQMTLRGPPPTI